MSDPNRSVAEYLLKHPLTDAEHDAIERARAGDCRGLWRRDGDGKWEQIR